MCKKSMRDNNLIWSQQTKVQFGQKVKTYCEQHINSNGMWMWTKNPYEKQCEKSYPKKNVNKSLMGIKHSMWTEHQFERQVNVKKQREQKIPAEKQGEQTVHVKNNVKKVY